MATKKTRTKNTDTPTGSSSDNPQSSTSAAQRSEWGRQGYEKSTEKLGKRNFHSQGGIATAKLDKYTDPKTGAVGIGALISAGWKPRKKHRYLGSCECHAHGHDKG